MIDHRFFSPTVQVRHLAPGVGRSTVTRHVDGHTPRAAFPNRFEHPRAAPTAVFVPTMLTFARRSEPFARAVAPVQLETTRKDRPELVIRPHRPNALSK